MNADIELTHKSTHLIWVSSVKLFDSLKSGVELLELIWTW